ncbi:MAG TPA: site-specific integrase [Polyangiaceae bacterium]
MTTPKGGRPATGSVKWRHNPDRVDPVTGKPAPGMQWWGRVTKANGRGFVPLDPSILEHERDAALACAVETAAWYRDNPTTVKTVRETVSEYARRWCDWRESRGMVCVKDDRARLKNHVLEGVGALDIRAVTRRDLERLVERLDERITKGDLGWKVAMMAWGNVTRMLKDACSAKRLDLRVRADDPSKDVQGPERGDKKEKQYLWPVEFLALITSPKTPPRWRVLFALAVYTYARAGEIAALTWDDVTFETNTIHIHASVDRVRRKGHVSSTKTGVSRRIPIEAELLPLLAAMHATAKGKGKVITAMPSAGMLSRKLRRYLGKAGVRRAELFAAGDPTRKAITFHDLRATGITWMAARGDDPLRIKQRAGHASFSTTEGYIREAENLGASFGEVFPALPEVLLEPLGGLAPVWPVPNSGSPSSQKQGVLWWAQQGLNL